MDMIKINYKITICTDLENVKIIDNVNACFDSNILFPEMIEKL